MDNDYTKTIILEVLLKLIILVWPFLRTHFGRFICSWPGWICWWYSKYHIWNENQNAGKVLYTKLMWIFWKKAKKIFRNLFQKISLQGLQGLQGSTKNLQLCLHHHVSKQCSCYSNDINSILLRKLHDQYHTFLVDFSPILLLQ